MAVVDDVADPPTLDPFLEFSQKNHTVLQQMLEGLVRLDPHGEIEPALAESWQYLEPVRLRFRLRPSVRFHNGTPLKAEDVRFSLERFVDSKGHYPGLGLFSSIQRIEVVDPLTVDVLTYHPDGVLLRRLAGLLTIVPEAYYLKVGSQGFSRHPVGTGPFQFVRWTPGREIFLRANPAYWQAGHPKIQELTFRFLPAENQVDALLSGEVDLVTELPGTATLRVKRHSRTDVLKEESLFTVAATFNVSRWPLSDRRFRQALNYAIDRTDLIRYDLLGNGKPVASLSLPGQIGYDPALKPYPYDPGRAKALLREMGIHAPVRLKVFANPQGARTAKILARQFKEVGILFEVEAIVESEILRRIQEGDWDVGIGSMPDPTGHSSFIQAILLYSQSPYSLFKSTEYDHRLEEFSSTLSPELQQAKGRALSRYLHTEALSLFTYQRIRTYGINRRVRFTPYITGMPYFHSLEISNE